MKKLKAFLRGDRAPKKDQREDSNPPGVIGRDSSDLFRTTVPLARGYLDSASTRNLNSPSSPTLPWTPAPTTTSSTVRPAARRAPSPVKRTTSPIRQSYGAPSRGRSALFPSVSSASNSHSTEIRDSAAQASFGARHQGRTDRLRHRRLSSDEQLQATGGRQATSATAKKPPNEDGEEESDADGSDMDDLLAMMIAASLASRSGAGGEASRSSDRTPGMEVLLLGAMLAAKARQKREGENQPSSDKGEEEKKRLEKIRRDEETERDEIDRAGQIEEARQATRQRQYIRESQRVRDTISRTGEYQHESFVEWKARRAREAVAEKHKTKEESKESNRRSGSAPLRGTTSVPTSTEPTKPAESRQSIDKRAFKVEPLPRTAALHSQTTTSQDQRTRQVQRENLKSRMEREQVPSVVPTPLPTTVPAPAPTSTKRKGPVFKVPPLSAAQRAAL